MSIPWTMVDFFLFRFVFNYFMILIFFLVFAWVISNVHEIWGKKKYKILNLGMQWGRDNDGSLFECACECLRCCDSNFSWDMGKYFSRDMGKFTLIIIWLIFYSGYLFACIVWHIQFTVWLIRYTSMYCAIYKHVQYIFMI